MKTIILTGNQANQKALCNKMAEVCDVVAIVLSDNIPRKKPAFLKRAHIFFNRLSNRTVGNVFVRVWFELLAKYDRLFPRFPDVPVTRVKNVNDKATINLIKEHDPDLIIVSGTNLVGKKIIRLAKQGKGIVNLHTGISPYVKGGPNCTNWCLAKNWFHLIGNTVMWLDIGIDTGKIISTEQTPLDGTESLFELHWKVMEHAHDLYVRAVRQIGEEKEVPAVSQDTIAKGTLFYSADWNLLEMWRAKKNFDQNFSDFFKTEDRSEAEKELTLIPLQ